MKEFVSNKDSFLDLQNQKSYTILFFVYFHSSTHETWGLIVNLSWGFYAYKIVVRAELKRHWLYGQWDLVSTPGVCAEGLGLG